MLCSSVCVTYPKGRGTGTGILRGDSILLSDF
uniref:Uncharacterized protein n=1 Tax=Anguilla anguilla TaxID=7936 RepID=A0A0E9SX47_ANGAN